MEKIVKRYVPQNYINPGFLDGLVLMSIMGAVVLSVVFIYPKDGSGTRDSIALMEPALEQPLYSIEKIVVDYPTLPRALHERQFLMEKLERIQRRFGEYLYRDREMRSHWLETTIRDRLLPVLASMERAIRREDSVAYANGVKSLKTGYLILTHQEAIDAGPSTRAGLVQRF